MLVIISDLHLTDGTSGQTIDPGAFTLFRDRLRETAFTASFRADGRYRPIDRIDLILLGDILDVLRSNRWRNPASGDVAPWSREHQPTQFSDKVAEITEAILERNQQAVVILRSLREGAILLPAATRKGQPSQSSKQEHPVEVSIHYMVGNHDWFYHLGGASFDDIRRRIIDALGLSHLTLEPFPHEPEESEDLSAVLEAHRVFARHGDLYDPFNFEKSRNRPSLGDAIVVGLLNRFSASVEDQLGDQLPRACMRGLRGIDAVRPHLLVPVWVSGILRKTCSRQRHVDQVKEVWNQLVDEFLALEFVRERDLFLQPDAVDLLQAALKISRRFSFQWSANILHRFGQTLHGRRLPSHRQALTEKSFKSRESRYIVYGHTHHQLITPLDSSLVEGQTFNQMYLNSGTWRKVFELARWSHTKQEFLGYHVMTYLSFFKEDERNGRLFEVWSGALGLSPD